MHRQSPFKLVGLLAALPIFAACGTDTLVDVASETAALITAQCDAQASNTAVDACFATFRTCKDAAGAVEADCRTALDACLPEGVPQRARHGGGCQGDGGMRGEGGPGHGGGGRPEGGPLGGLFGPPPGDADGGVRGRGGPGGHRGHGGGPRGSIGVDDAAVEACRATSDACVAGGGDEQTCRDAARTCLHDAFAAAFAARCDELTTACAANAGTNCDELTQRCAAGLGSPDAGTCQAP